jgi:hypothetical protein
MLLGGMRVKVPGEQVNFIAQTALVAAYGCPKLLLSAVS